MFAGIATLEMDAFPGVVSCVDLVLMDGRSVVMVRVVVAPIDMSVRDHTLAGAGSQGHSEHDRQKSLHLSKFTQVRPHG